MAMYGYCRVSSLGQSLEIQEEKLRDYGCEVIRSEKKSAASTKDREELNTLLTFLREGDSLVVTRLDRLARSMYDLQNIVKTLEEKSVALVITEQNIDTSTSYGKMFINILGTVAEFERSLIRERQAEGIKKLKERGGYNGRPKTIDDDALVALHKEGQSVHEICRTTQVSRASVYRALKQYRDKGVLNQSTTSSSTQ